MNTDEKNREAALLTIVAQESSVPIALLEKLAQLKDEIPDLNIWGAKAKLSRMVEAILDEEAAWEPHS